MACTTLLVGKNASYDGSTIMARNEDTPNGMFNVKKLVVVQPEDQPRHYRSVCSHVEMDLPGNPLRYTNIPDSTRGDGIWGEAGINEANVAMTATETIMSATAGMRLSFRIMAGDRLCLLPVLSLAGPFNTAFLSLRHTTKIKIHSI